MEKSIDDFNLSIGEIQVLGGGSPRIPVAVWDVNIMTNALVYMTAAAFGNAATALNEAFSLTPGLWRIIW